MKRTQTCIYATQNNIPILMRYMYYSFILESDDIHLHFDCNACIKIINSCYMYVVTT